MSHNSDQADRAMGVALLYEARVRAGLTCADDQRVAAERAAAVAHAYEAAAKAVRGTNPSAYTGFLAHANRARQRRDEHELAVDVECVFEQAGGCES